MILRRMKFVFLLQSTKKEKRQTLAGFQDSGRVLDVCEHKWLSWLLFTIASCTFFPPTCSRLIFFFFGCIFLFSTFRSIVLALRFFFLLLLIETSILFCWLVFLKLQIYASCILWYIHYIWRQEIHQNSYWVHLSIWNTSLQILDP